ncbi:Von willebrand factor type A domain protein [Oopsacas minuta]|uniref:von willebrand factor type A domain protein n=1 Tax=Oopsacas minuta TaxID=111878 RepID=A0AAV7JHF5_9METZ|nr:Von willebrand factor type A domain protein [Oopsacas minuta]
MLKVCSYSLSDNKKFTTQHRSVQQFLENVKPEGGGDYPEAVLDGLANAATKCDWELKPGVRNVIIHIYDAPPHGDFPNYNSHDSKSSKENCCCCNHGKLCNFDWKTDVWNILQKFQIQYHGINTGRCLPQYEATMKDNLKGLCGDFQTVGKEVVNEAIVQIFIDYKMD